MITSVVPILLTIFAGFCIVLQQALNANLRTALDSAVWSGLASYLVGSLCMAGLAIALRETVPPASALARIPLWAWSGGVFGAVFIGLAVVLIPQIGAATFMAVLITGQMLSSIVFDHFGLLGLMKREFDPARLAGVALLIAGVILIRR